MEPVIERPLLPIVPNDPNIPDSLRQWAISLTQALTAALQQHGFAINYFSGELIELKAKPPVSGSRGGNEALDSLLIALSNLGLITNNTIS